MLSVKQYSAALLLLLASSLTSAQVKFHTEADKQKATAECDGQPAYVQFDEHLNVQFRCRLKGSFLIGNPKAVRIEPGVSIQQLEERLKAAGVNYTKIDSRTIKFGLITLHFVNGALLDWSM